MFTSSNTRLGWLGNRVVSMLDSGAEGPRFKSQPRCCRVTVLVNCSHPSCLCSPTSEICSSPLKGCEGNCGPGEKYWQPTAGFMIHVTCRLTAKNRDHLRNPTLGNRVWASEMAYTVSSGALNSTPTNQLPFLLYCCSFTLKCLSAYVTLMDTRHRLLLLVLLLLMG